MASRSSVAASGRWLEGIRKWYYNAAGFNKLGLMRDDTIHETDDVKEAIRRLPENLYNDRMFRIKRALDLTMRHQILPKEQWTKYEEGSDNHSTKDPTCTFMRRPELKHLPPDPYKGV
uniref:Cytochrome b-c1 complex subunit 7 n=1 Tax=Ailuropoda melanoleuca TaxID=9646 RepID=A0A7N5KRT6_AILME